MTVKSFSATDNTQLTEHFNAREFRCKCGKSHDFLISDELVSKLEQLYAALTAARSSSTAVTVVLSMIKR